MDFRITKIKTQAENFGSPISVSLAEIVNRMKDGERLQHDERGFETRLAVPDILSHFRTTGLTGLPTADGSRAAQRGLRVGHPADADHP